MNRNPAISGSCPNLLEDNTNGQQHAEPLNNKPFISNLFKNHFNIHVDIIISSAEAEDLAGISPFEDMIPRYRQRSLSLDKVRTTTCSV